MTGYWFVNPANYAQKYVTVRLDDPGIPSGYVLMGGNDGAIDIPQQNFQPGAASGGYPSYPTPNAGETFQQMMQRLNDSQRAGIAPP